jgi:GH15 family glucan-1,4-alpha-glucosidase
MKNHSFPRRAPGGPGIEPRWTHGAKVAVGTAYSTSSRVWYTLDAGCVTEVYYPTIDTPQIRDVQFLFTDGETFFHDERRNFTTEIDCVNSLVASQKDREFREQQELLTQAAQQTDQLSEVLYKNGGSSYLQVLTSETNHYSAELNLVQAQLNERLALVQLYQALGGGWKQ